MGSDAGWSSLVARRAHNPKVAGSNPPPATWKSPRKSGGFLWDGPLAERAKVPIGFRLRGPALASVCGSLGGNPEPREPQMHVAEPGAARPRYGSLTRELLGVGPDVGLSTSCVKRRWFLWPGSRTLAYASALGV